MRDSFIFYRTFYDCIKELPVKSGYALYNAILQYEFTGETPGLSGLEQGIFSMIKAQLDANNRRYENGKKGGRPPTKETNGFENDIEKNNLNETKTKPNKNVNVNVNDKKELCAFFDEVWKLYPCKKGKGQVSDAAKERLFKVGLEELTRAIERYNAELERDSDWRKPQNGSTFFNSGYIDYLDSNYVPDKKKSSSNANQFNQFKQNDYDYDALEKELLGY